MKNKRTNIDFAKHELQIFSFDGVLIHQLKKPDTRIDMFVFVNTCGVMSVTGDYGNWIFCREFHPSADGGVSAGYWDEKLEISSQQKSDAFDTEHTLELINDFVVAFEDQYDRPMNEDEIEWIDLLRSAAFDEIEYLSTAYREKPSTIDYESVPFGKKRHYWLDAVYDAFDHICTMLKEKSEKATA